jgi:hypothetical protein
VARVICGECPVCSASSGIDSPGRICSEAKACRRSYGGMPELLPFELALAESVFARLTAGCQTRRHQFL